MRFSITTTILLSLLLFISLSFHFIPSKLLLFPKDHLTFDNTIIEEEDIDALIERYNNSSAFEREAMNNEPYIRTLKKQGIIVDIEHENNSSQKITPIIIHHNNSEEFQVANMVWAGRNLNVTQFQNGDIITEAKSVSEWIKLNQNQKPAWCYYNNDPSNEANYGKLYNWYAVNDSRNISPPGWYIPCANELRRLEMFFSDCDNQDNLMNHLGYRDALGVFRYAPKGGWWSSSDFNINYAWGFQIDSDKQIETFNGGNKGTGLPVRCIKGEHRSH